MKVQWLAKVSTGEWWEFNSSPGALSCTLMFLLWQGKGVWYHIHSEQKHTLSLSSSCISSCSGSLLSPLSPFPSFPSPLSLSLPQLGLMFTPGWNVQECFIIRWSHLQHDAVTETTRGTLQWDLSKLLWSPELAARPACSPMGTDGPGHTKSRPNP